MKNRKLIWFIYQVFSIQSLYFKSNRIIFSMLPSQIASNFITYEEIYTFMHNYNSYFCWKSQEENFSTNFAGNFLQNALPISQQLPKPTESQNAESDQHKAQSIRRKKHVRNPSKQGQSAKKNGESNLVNQFFSLFDSRERSSKVVMRVIGMLDKPVGARQKIMTVFYHVIRLINIKRGRKYVNRFFLKKIFTPQSLSQLIPELEAKMEKVEEVTLFQICKIFRKCLSYFMKKICTCAVLTSKRISTVSKQEHLRKRRIVYVSLNTPETK